MRQRNDTGYVQQVRAWPTDDYPDHALFDVGAGEEIDFPVLLAGFALLDAPSAEQGADAPLQPDAPAKAPRKAAKSTDTQLEGAQGGEPA